MQVETAKMDTNNVHRVDKVFVEKLMLEAEVVAEIPDDVSVPGVSR